MTSDLTLDMLHVMVRGLMMLMGRIPADDADIGLLHECKRALEWLQAQAPGSSHQPEITVLFSTSIVAVSQMIDHANEQTRIKSAKRTHELGDLRPFNLVSLIATWDRDFPGGSAAVLAQLEEVVSESQARRQTDSVSCEE